MGAYPILFCPGVTSNGPILYVMRLAPPASDCTATALPSGAASAGVAATATRASIETSAHPARFPAATIAGTLLTHGPRFRLIRHALSIGRLLGAAAGHADERAEDRSHDEDKQHRAKGRDPRGERLPSAPAQALASASFSSCRSDLISSRSLAAYSKRRSSAAASISSSSSTMVRRSSSADMPSVSRRRRPRLVGTFDSAIRKSVMSEMPFWIVAGVIPCAS